VHDSLVAEVKNWVLPDFVRYMAEMEQSLQRMMERMLARQTEEINDREDTADAESGARQDQLKEDIKAIRKPCWKD
jgi:hypothetical protein